MTERDPSEEIASLRAALAAERLKGAAFAELSHELRTLIAGVIGLSGLLLDTELTPEQRDYVKRVRGFSDALVGLVNNVLDYSRYEAGKFELERVDLDLRRLVDEVGELCADRARQRGLELVASVAADVPPLRGDPTRLRQVLMNLVSNALKYTERGEVVLRADFVAQGPPQPPLTVPQAVGAAAETVTIRVEVRDTGVGISPEGQARLFRPFSQVSPGDASTGSGLGLALSKRIVEAMGGEVGVTSEPGKGSTFHVTVQLERRPSGANRNAIPRVDMAGRAVVCAVGNAASRACLEEMMAPLGVTFEGAADAESALAALQRRKPCDIILLDTALPGASELMRALDADEALATVPVVLLAYPGRRMDERPDPSSEGPRAGRQTGRRTGERPDPGAEPGRAALAARPGGAVGGTTGGTTRVITNLAKPVRQSHLLACLRTLMGSAVEKVTPAPESRRAAPIRPPADPVGPAFGRPAEERPRVLLVEDNAVNQRVGRLMMEKRGYSVEVAGDGYEAVEATARTVFHAVLMDCHMPRFDGYSATQAIRTREAADPGKPRLPIIAMTANAGPGARERCIEAGMDDYVAKPVTSEALDGVLRRWVTRAPGPPGIDAGSAPRALAPPPPPAAPPVRRPSSPTVDLGMLRKLRASQSAGEPDIVAEVISLFLEDAPARLAAIQTAVERGDLPTAARTAHTLKGSAGHLGAKTLALLCARLEEKVRGGTPFNAGFAVDAIAEELGRVRAALTAEGTAAAARREQAP